MIRSQPLEINSKILYLTSRLTEFLSGFWDELAIFIGVIPFGIIFAILALQAVSSVPERTAMSLIVFASSSQLMFVQLAGLNAPLPVLDCLFLDWLLVICPL